MFERPPGPMPRRHRHDPRHGPGNLPFPFRAMFGRTLGTRRPLRRGEIRPLILAALAERPMHGYEVIQELEARSGGRWRPSAGSVYPTLQQLADEGLVSGEEVEGRRVYTLTADGRAAATATPRITACARFRCPSHDRAVRYPDVPGLPLPLPSPGAAVRHLA